MESFSSPLFTINCTKSFLDPKVKSFTSSMMPFFLLSVCRSYLGAPWSVVEASCENPDVRQRRRNSPTNRGLIVPRCRMEFFGLSDTDPPSGSPRTLTRGEVPFEHQHGAEEHIECS